MSLFESNLCLLVKTKKVKEKKKLALACVLSFKIILCCKLNLYAWFALALLFHQV